MRTHRAVLAFLIAVPALAVPVPAAVAQVDPSTGDLPVFSREVPRGESTTVAVGESALTPKTVDGDLSDWTGDPSRYGGTVVYSGGELVYQDHLFDAHGPDDGRDAARFERTDPIEAAVPEAYRIDALAQADAPGELGLPAPEQFRYDDTYGDAIDHQDQADLEEVRVAVDGEELVLLARTTTMTADPTTALLLLADTGGDPAAREIPFGSGIASDVADVAAFIPARGQGRVVDLATGASTALPAGSIAADPSGYTNSLEARIPLGGLGTRPLRLAVASGSTSADGTGFAPLGIETADDQPHANLANVAFRPAEPSRSWFEREQALALHSGTIDPFFLDVDTAKLSSGVRERLVPGFGYHDRIFVSSEKVSTERSRDGIFQHYGVFLPSNYDGAAEIPLQWWLHWRGGNAHTGAAVVPRVFKHFGEDLGSIVVSPSGRGTSRWYVAKGHVDILEVWRDVFETFVVDRNRVYVSGHSMGGFGTYLLTLLYPDRFAAGAPVAGPVTQGAWTGADFPGCDDMSFDENTPCYIGANDSRPRDQHTRRLLENARHVPYAILHGTDDELVPYTGVARQAERLLQLGYRFRFYTYPGYEHYSHPVMDQWAEAARYMHSFVRPENPRRVTYERDMPFELATEEVQADGVDLDFSFDSAYWMSELTPVDETAGVASFDGTSLAVAEQPQLVAPDAGGPAAPGATGPYIALGQQWLDDPTAAPPDGSNGFEATLSGARAVRLDLAGMQIDPGATVTGTLTTDSPLSLRLDGNWGSPPTATVDGSPVDVSSTDGVAEIHVPAGSHQIVVEPPADEPPQPEATALDLRVEGNGGARRLVAALTDAGGSHVEGRTVVFEADGATIGTAVTDAAGVATFDPPPRFSGGKHVFSARFEGDSSYGPSSDSA